MQLAASASFYNMLSLRKIYAIIVVSMAGNVFWIQVGNVKLTLAVITLFYVLWSLNNKISINYHLLSVFCESAITLSTGNQSHLLFKNAFTDILPTDFFYISSAETQHMPLLTARESSMNESFSSWAFQIQLIRGRGGCEGLWCQHTEFVIGQGKATFWLLWAHGTFAFVGLFLFVSK